MSNPVSDLEREVEELRVIVERIDKHVWGDRNQVEAYKETLRGKVEHLQALSKELVTIKQHNELEEALGNLSKTVTTFTTTLNRGITIVLTSALGAAGLWLFNRITGGS